MGFLNGLLKGLGFETNKQTQQKSKIDKNESNELSYKNAGAEYNLSNLNIEEKKIYKPISQQEVQNIVDLFKKDQSVTVDLQNLTGIEFVRALDFMSGAIYVLDGKISKIGEKVFFFCPKIN